MATNASVTSRLSLFPTLPEESASRDVIQTNHYYPYGLLFAESAYPDKQSYKYIGKELDTERGLNWYDLGARLYDGIRMPTPDPMMEK